MNKIIALDVDGVVADLLPAWIDWYNRDYNDNLDYRTVNQWDLIPFVKSECGSKIYRYITNPLLYNDVKPIEFSVEGVDILRRFGFRVIFVTQTPIGCSGRKLSWLNEHGFNVLSKDYFEAEDKSLITAKYLVDDRDLNVINAYGQGIIFTAGYNKTLTGYPRVNNWYELVGFFQGEIA